MKRFRFTLDPLLRLRRRNEEQAQIALAGAQRRLAREREQLEELHAELRRHQAQRARLQVSALDIQALLDLDRYGEALARTELLQQERVREAASAVEAARETLHRCRLERETLERLRERRLEEHRVAALAEEQKLLDEAAVLRWRR